LDTYVAFTRPLLASVAYEIIVLNDASTDATPEIASRAGAKVIPIIDAKSQASRNAGARAAQASIVLH